MNILFDLDGTLIDSTERMYCLFMELVPHAPLSKEKYWGIKRRGTGHREMIREYFPHMDFAEFQDAWMSGIEEDRYLAMDTKWEDTDAVLELLGDGNSLFLVTARQKKKSLADELDRLGMSRYFKDVFVTENKCTKKELLRLNSGICTGDAYFVSDGGTDIRVGNELGLKTVAAAYGFLDADVLRRYGPLYMVHSLREAGAVLNR